MLHNVIWGGGGVRFSGKNVPVIQYFQTAAFSVGFDLDAIEQERWSRFKRFNTKSQRMQDHVAPVSYYNKKQVCLGDNNKSIAFASSQKAKRLKTAQLRVKMVEDLGVKRYSVREDSGLWHQKLNRGSCLMKGMRKRKLLCYIMKHSGYIVKKPLNKCKIVNADQC